MNSWLETVLRCPITGASLTRDGDSYVSTGSPTYRYRIEANVPNLLPGEAELVSGTDLRKPADD